MGSKIEKKILVIIKIWFQNWPQDSDLEDENDDCISMVSAFDRKSVASNSSFISLMSGQSSFRCPLTDNGLNRNDLKRHSLMSFRRLKSEDGTNGLGGRNSALRRSAILTRPSRMSAIEENKSKFQLYHCFLSKLVKIKVFCGSIEKCVLFATESLIFNNLLYNFSPFFVLASK